MRPKVKLIATIASLAMAVALISFATFAAFQPSYTFEGVVVITPIEGANISITEENAGTLLADFDPSTTSFAYLEQIEIEEGKDLTFTITITNTSPSLSIYVKDFNFEGSTDFKGCFTITPSGYIQDKKLVPEENLTIEVACVWS